MRCSKTDSIRIDRVVNDDKALGICSPMASAGMPETIAIEGVLKSQQRALLWDHDSLRSEQESAGMRALQLPGRRKQRRLRCVSRRRLDGRARCRKRRSRWRGVPDRHRGLDALEQRRHRRGYASEQHARPKPRTVSADESAADDARSSDDRSSSQRAETSRSPQRFGDDRDAYRADHARGGVRQKQNERRRDAYLRSLQNHAFLKRHEPTVSPPKKQREAP